MTSLKYYHPTQHKQTLTSVRLALPAAVASVLLLAGCGGGGSGGGSNGANADSGGDPGQTGAFLDAAVSNIDYTTSSGVSGITNADGEFDYAAGDSVSFTIGDIEFPAAAAKEVVTPLDMSENGELDERVSNIIRLIQTLDEDGDASNGITISDATKTAAASITLDFDQPSEDFENDSGVTNFVSNSGASKTSLISAEEAEAHFAETLKEESISDSSAEEIYGTHILAGSTSGVGESGAEAAFIFANDGRAFMAQIADDPNSDAFQGYEAGTYSKVGDNISFSIDSDTNGTAGVNDNGDSSDGGTLGFSVNTISPDSLAVTLTNTSEDPAPGLLFDTVAKEDEGLAGTWGVQGQEGEEVVIAFDGNDAGGEYVLIGVGGETDGIEFGTYAISGGLIGGGATFVATTEVDTNDDAGLSDAIYGIELNTDGSITLTEPGDPSTTLVRIDN